jgi:hypothetical protein
MRPWDLFQLELGGGLRLVRMFGTLVDVQLAQDGPTEPVVGNHSLDGALEDELGVPRAAGLDAFRMVAADEAGERHVFLLRFFLAGEDGLFGVDDDDKVTGIDVRGKNGLVLAAQENGGFFGDTADDLVGRVDHMPLTFDLFGLGAKSFHREPAIKPARGGGVKKILGELSATGTACKKLDSLSDFPRLPANRFLTVDVDAAFKGPAQLAKKPG